MRDTHACHRLLLGRRRFAAPLSALLLALLLLTLAATPSGAATLQLFTDLGGGAACTGDPDDGEHVVTPQPAVAQPGVAVAAAPIGMTVEIAPAPSGPAVVAVTPSPRARLSWVASLWLSLGTLSLHR